MNDMFGTWLTYLRGDLWPGLATTIQLTVVCTVLTVIWAIVPALMRMSGNRVANAAAMAYIEVFRSTPSLVQLFAVFFGLAVLGVLIDPWPAAILVLVLNAGGSLAESYRSGFQAVPNGQRESAASLGMNQRVAFRRVVFPIAVRIILPAIGNMTINILLITPIAALIGVEDLMYEALAIQGREHDWSVYLLIAILYVILGLGLSSANGYAERRLKLP
jgi:cystine transport system permease protein